MWKLGHTAHRTRHISSVAPHVYVSWLSIGSSRDPLGTHKGQNGSYTECILISTNHTAQGPSPYFTCTDGSTLLLSCELYRTRTLFELCITLPALPWELQVLVCGHLQGLAAVTVVLRLKTFVRGVYVDEIVLSRHRELLDVVELHRCCSFVLDSDIRANDHTVMAEHIQSIKLSH